MDKYYEDDIKFETITIELARCWCFIAFPLSFSNCFLIALSFMVYSIISTSFFSLLNYEAEECCFSTYLCTMYNPYIAKKSVSVKTSMSRKLQIISIYWGNSKLRSGKELQ